MPHSLKAVSRRLFVSIALGMMVLTASVGIGGAQEQTVNAVDQAAIVDVISRQMAAFQADRGLEAFSYASPNIQRMFGDPETFMTMVRRGYRVVYRPQSVDFLELTLTQGRITQPVLILGEHGRLVIADYFMEQQEDGAWRIDGVVLREPDDAAV